MRELLAAIGEDPEREGLRDTPARVARAYAELTAGMRQTPEDVLTTTFDLGHDEMVLVRDIELWSMCEHHLVPFTGVAHVGYIPAESGKITGLSKLARLVDVYAKRPQVQERLTTQVADALMEILDARGVIVVIEAEHLCMTMRGVRKAGARTITSAVRGQMRDARDPRRGDGAHPPEAVTDARGPAADGRRQRHPRLLLRRRPLRRPGGRDRPRPPAARRRRRHPRRRRRVDPARRHPAAGRGGAGPGGPGDRGARRRRRRGLGRHDARRGRRGPRSTPARRIVNDVSGGLADPAILDVVAGSGATYVAMHWRGHADRMQSLASYDEPAASSPRSRASWRERVGRGPRGRHRRRPARARPRAWASPRPPTTTGRCSPGSTGSPRSGYPLLVGGSRKSFLGSLLADADGTPRPVDDREAASTALTAAARAARACGASGCTTSAPAATRCAVLAATGGGAPMSADELTISGHRVLRAPRRLRPRAARRPDLRDRSHPGPRHPSRGGLATTCRTRSTTEASWPG